MQSTKQNKVDAVIITVTACVITVLLIAAMVYWRKKKETNCSRTRGFAMIEESRARPVISFEGS